MKKVAAVVAAVVVAAVTAVAAVAAAIHSASIFRFKVSARTEILTRKTRSCQVDFAAFEELPFLLMLKHQGPEAWPPATVC